MIYEIDGSGGGAMIHPARIQIRLLFGSCATNTMALVEV